MKKDTNEHRARVAGSGVEIQIRTAKERAATDLSYNRVKDGDTDV